MPGNPLLVLADAPDDGPTVAVGPVYSEDAALALAKEIAAAGFKPSGVRRHMSAAAFREMVKVRGIVKGDGR
jgi:hypothetical protein